MGTDIIVGRSEADKKRFGDKGLILIGRQYVKMGREVSLANNIYMDVNRSHVVFICGKRGSGKCVHEDTLIQLDDGRQIPIKELENNKNKILGLNEKLKIEKLQKRDFFKRSVKDLIHLRLRSGREIKLTPEHPLLTIKSWRPVNELKVGSRIAVPRRLDSFGNNSIPHHRIKLLAYFIAEGHTKKIALFSNSDPDIIKDFKESMKKFDSALDVVEEKKGCYRLTQHHHNTIVLDSKIIRDKTTCRFLKGTNNTFKKRSIRLLFEQEGLYNKSSLEKYIPKSIMALNKEGIRLLLNRLFSCDGSIYHLNKGDWEVSYSSSSEKLIRQIQNLLLRFDILSKLRYKKVKYNGYYKDAFELVLNGVNVKKFIENIGFFGIKKIKEGLALDYLNKTIRNPNIDTIPKEVWDLYKPKNWAEVGRAFGYKHPKAMRERLRYSPSRDTLLQISEADQNQGIKLLAESDIFWDEIVSMELLEGKFTVYDINVPNFHNFVANDIIVHNSYSQGVIAEGVADLPEEVKNNVAVLILDTMGIFWTMKTENRKDEDLLKEWNLESKGLDIKIYTPKGYYQQYLEDGIPTDFPFSIKPNELDALDWCNAFGIEQFSSSGVLMHRVIKRLEGQNYSVKDFADAVQRDIQSDENTKNKTISLLLTANDWGLFDKGGTKIKDIIKGGQVSVLDVSCYATTPGGWGIKGLAVGLIAKKLFTERMITRKQEELDAVQKGYSYLGESGEEETESKLQMDWLVIVESHEFLPEKGKNAATDALVTILKEGRQPGISLILATQQPGKIHGDVLTQSDLIIAHKIPAKKDVDALNAMMQSYMVRGLTEAVNELPGEKGAAVILDDNSERIYPMRIRPRFSWHCGEAPSAIKSSRMRLKLNI